MRYWLRVLTRALEAAYGMGTHQAFLSFSKRNKPQHGDLIQNADAYAVAERMAQDLRDSAVWAEEKLREC